MRVCMPAYRDKWFPVWFAPCYAGIEVRGRRDRSRTRIRTTPRRPSGTLMALDALQGSLRCIVQIGERLDRCLKDERLGEQQSVAQVGRPWRYWGSGQAEGRHGPM